MSQVIAVNAASKKESPVNTAPSTEVQPYPAIHLMILLILGFRNPATNDLHLNLMAFHILSSPLKTVSEVTDTSALSP